CSSMWQIPDLDSIEPIMPRHEPLSLPYEPYARDEVYLSRSWVLPGTKGLIHQLGGLEKDMKSGKVSYDAKNHESMTIARALKIERVKDFVKAPQIFGEEKGDVLLVGFGGTFGALRQACIDLCAQDYKVSHLHLELLNPLHDQIGTYLSAFSHVVIAEHNLSQLRTLLRAKFLIDATGLNKVMGKPFLVEEVINHVKKILNPKDRAIS
ncbi:MAG TPA: 2-oxoglutarate ferredoxin oxidoreductase subunit alpha, partial [Myxococcota bacterium]|nr:2-oxoglutarate ferredoxin oxidoreductase subunit alpha [Myxococcota bacterium]